MINSVHYTNIVQEVYMQAYVMYKTNLLVKYFPKSLTNKQSNAYFPESHKQ